MASKIVEVLIAEPAEFEIDNSESQVPLTQVAAGEPFANESGLEYFAEIDNALLLEMGITLPYQYCLGEGSLTVQLSWQSEGGTLVGVYSGFIPYANAPFSFGDGGLYLRNPQNDGGTDKYRLRISVQGFVSMVYNPPTIPQGEVLQVEAWLKVQHLLPLESGS